jgi:hypothetical protein
MRSAISKAKPIGMFGVICGVCMTDSEPGGTAGVSHGRDERLIAV